MHYLNELLNLFSVEIKFSIEFPPVQWCNKENQALKTGKSKLMHKPRTNLHEWDATLKNVQLKIMWNCDETVQIYSCIGDYKNAPCILCRNCILGSCSGYLSE